MIGVLRWLRSNLWTILLSLLVGLTIWVIVNQEQNPVREQDFSPDIKISGMEVDPKTVLIAVTLVVVLVHVANYAVRV